MVLFSKIIVMLAVLDALIYDGKDFQILEKSVADCNGNCLTLDMVIIILGNFT